MEIFLTTLKREFSKLWTSPRNLIVLVGTPLFFMLIFGYMYSTHVVNHIPTVVLDYSDTALSRQIVQAFQDADKFQIVGYVSSEGELRSMIERGEAEAAVVIPPDLVEQVKKLHSTPLLVIVNGSNMIISNSVVTYASEIVSTVSGGTAIKIMEAKGMMPETALDTATILSFRPRVWYNPTFNYGNFLMLGLLGTAVQQVIFLFTSISIVEEKRQQAVREIATSLRRLTLYICGKVTPYVVTNLLTINISILILVGLFGIPFRGSVGTLLLLELVFVSGVTALGIFISIVSKNPLEATQTSMLVAVPSFLLSGYTWPISAMPKPLQIVAEILPLTHFVNSLRKIAVMGLGIKLVYQDILVLALLAAIFIPASIFALRGHIKGIATKAPSLANGSIAQ